jgi:dihydroorotase
MTTLILHGGHLVDPVSAINAPRDLLLRDGFVAAVDSPGAFHSVSDAESLDASGCIVAPGLVDVHVHLREPGQTYKETIATGTAAAAAGGFTSVVAMPNTLPVNDSVGTLEWMLAPERNPLVRLFAMPAVTTGSQGGALTDFDALAAAGAVGFTDDGKPVLHGHIMREALLRAGRLGLVVSQHAEDTRIPNSSGINAGPVAFRLGLRGMSVEAESSIVERDIELVREIEEREGVRAHLHVQHISTAAALAAVRRAKAAGLNVTCEAAPHHFALTDEAIGEFDTNCKMNPPLRSEHDRQAVIAGLLDGTIDCIATDHAPHARHEKEVEFERAPNGITGLETALGLALRMLHREHSAPLSRIVELLSARPAKIVSLQRAGSLGLGQWGDAVVFNAGTEWSFEAAKSRSKSKNTPFDGAAMLGKIRATVVGGKVVFQEP